MWAVDVNVEALITLVVSRFCYPQSVSVDPILTQNILGLK